METSIPSRSSAAAAQAVEASVAIIARRWSRVPRVGIVLGTGLGGFAREIAAEATISYDELPAFSRATAPGHAGRLTCGTVSGVPIVAMEGRFHRYEGYTVEQITLPIHVMRRLGATQLVVSNAAGAVNPDYRVGDVMLIADHINLMGAGSKASRVFRFGETARDESAAPGIENQSLHGDLAGRFPLAEGSPYDPDLIANAARVARRHDFACRQGVYVAVTGPNYETRAEYRFLRRIGGDVIGMSTVPEALVARRLGLQVLAVSTVTNVCRPDALEATDGRQVVDAAAAAEPNLRAIVCGLIEDAALSS